MFQNQPGIHLFDNWKAMRALLSSAIQNYTGACDSLRRGLHDSMTLSHSKMVEQALLDIDSELTLLEFEEDRLRSARTSLYVIRNRSTTLVPINALPPELLVRIFGFIDPSLIAVASDTKLARTPYYPESLLGVCKGWRQLVISTPMLWPYIDIVADSTNCQEVYRHARLRSKYSGNVPLHIRIKVPSYAPLEEQAVHMLEEFMMQHAGQISTLDVEIHRYTEALLNSVLLSWTKYASTTRSRGLLIASNLPTPFNIWDIVQIKSSDLDRESNLARLDLLLEKLEVLHLEGALLDWRGVAFRGLVDLNLRFFQDDFSPTASDIFAVLSSSPALRHLAFDEMTFRAHNDTTIGPVRLQCLETLDVSGLGPPDIALLLSMIFPGNGNLDIFLPLIKNPNVLSTIRDFFHRSRITKLRVLAILEYDWEYLLDGSQPWLQLEHLPHLRELGLFHGSTEAEEDNEAGEFPLPKPCQIYPKLDTLYLHGCALKKDAVQKAIDLCSVRAIRIAGCFRVEERDHLKDETSLFEWLSELTPNAQAFHYRNPRLIA